MIKKVTKIKTLTDKFPLPVDVLQINPPLKDSDYLTGGFYKTKGYSMYAFYESDAEGNILDNNPIIHDEGLNTYAEIFQQLDYTYI